jgi:hypothetical protein
LRWKTTSSPTWLDDLTIAPLLLWAAAKVITGDVMDAARDAVRRKREHKP